MLNKKMLVAPILAVALVLSLAAAVSYLPLSAQTTVENQLAPTPTPTILNPYGVVHPNTSSGYSSALTPLPTSAPPAAAPTAEPVSTASSFNFLPILSVAAAIVIGIVAGLLLFSEKSLKKELGTEEE